MSDMSILDDIFMANKLGLTVYRSSQLYDSTWARRYNVYVATESAEKIEEIIGIRLKYIPQITWAKIEIEDSGFDASIVPYYRAALENPNKVICDLFPFPILLYPWGTKELDVLDNITLGFEVVEWERKCEVFECTNLIPHNSLCMVHKNKIDNKIKHICKMCAVKILNEEKNKGLQYFASMHSLEKYLDVSIFNETLPLEGDCK